MTGTLGGTKERPNALRPLGSWPGRARRHKGSLSRTATATSADATGSIDLGEEGVEVLDERLVNGADLSVERSRKRRALARSSSLRTAR